MDSLRAFARRAARVVLGAIERSGQIDADGTSEIRFDAGGGFTIVLRSGAEVVIGFADPDERLARLGPLQTAGLDLSIPQRIDLESDAVAIAAPLDPSP